MFSLDVKRMQEKRQRHLEQLLKKRADESPQAKEKRIQRLYGKTTTDMYAGYQERVQEFVQLEPASWTTTYGAQSKVVTNPMVWPRDTTKEIQPRYIDAGNYETKGRKFRGGGEKVPANSEPPPSTTSPFREPTAVFHYDAYHNPIESPFRLRLKPKEIQPPLRYNTVVRDFASKVLEADKFDMTWTEAAVFPEWRERAPDKWYDSDFGLTFASGDTKTAAFQGISCIKTGATLDSTEPFSPATARPPAVPNPFTARATTAPMHAERLYLNSILTADGGQALVQAARAKPAVPSKTVATERS
ncbi:hypothetical protein ACHHYP_14916 [Achlya hypogyna]|uniref:Uncharacterized protein n=1 Tax=Achlya hypogyna TaxID=1202772 RepID=A0A1V9YBZ7_ACHHY|nr:hypothetical protein ACHHYP_14916 [Achlya hypogyna]